MKTNHCIRLFFALSVWLVGCKEKNVTPDQVVEPLVLGTEITTKTVLEDRVADPNLPDYIVNGTLSVKAELSIRPGVVIAFARDARLDILDNGGSLIAQGQADKKIRFTGIEKSKGTWAGIMMYSASSANELDHVEVLYAGSRPLTSNIKAGIALVGNSKAQLALKNSLLAHNDGYGMLVQDGAVLRSFAANTFGNNTLAGITLDANNVKYLDKSSVFTQSNGRNVVEITASELSRSPAGEVLWEGFTDQTPYRLAGNLNVKADWKLAPGVTLELGRDVQMNVDAEAYLDARATAAAPITIKGAEAGAGYWKGLICYSPSARNVLEYVHLSGGGSIPLVSAKKTTIAVYGSQAAMTIRNSRISQSGGHGIFVNYQARINDDVLTANTFENNGQTDLVKE